MRNRHRTRQRGSPGYAHLIPSLCDWASQGSRLLLVSGKKDPKNPRYFATDIVEGVQKSPVPVIWALSKSRLNSPRTTLSDVLCMLTVQALQIPRSPIERVPISPAEMEMTTASEEWLLLLKRALSGLKQAYIIIDTDILKGSTSRRDQHRAVGLMNNLLKQTQSIGLDLRIILVAGRFADVSESSNAEKEPQVLKMCSDVPERKNAQRRSFAVSAAKGRASRHRTGRGKDKRFAGLAGQVLVNTTARSRELGTWNAIPG